MSANQITVRAKVHADLKKVWDCYTQAKHIVNWNFADVSWHCPKAENDLRLGGRYFARMEAKDGSFGFDFEATYTDLKMEESFVYSFGGRTCKVTFDKQNNDTEVTVCFDPETENSLELQQQGWQAILTNFKQYTESLPVK